MADLVMKQARAIIDERTTTVCLDIHGIIMPVDQPFETLAGDFMQPPFHVHCRTLVGPYMPGFIKEARKAANKELKTRPASERRRGPGGPDPSTIPGPVTGNPPSGFSRRDEEMEFLNPAVEFTKPDAVPEADPWAPDIADALPAVDGPVIPATALSEGSYSSWWAENLVPVPGMERIMRVYTNKTGFKMNDQLRGKLEFDADRQKDIDAVVGLINAQTPLDDNILVYRGLDGAGMDLKQGMTLKEEAFMSTAAGRDLAIDFAYRTKEPTLLEITVPKGNRVINAEKALGRSEGDFEEIVLPPGMVLQFGEERMETIDKNEYRVLKAMVVPDPAAPAEPEVQEQTQPWELIRPENMARDLNDQIPADEFREISPDHQLAFDTVKAWTQGHEGMDRVRTGDLEQGGRYLEEILAAAPDYKGRLYRGMYVENLDEWAAMQLGDPIDSRIASSFTSREQYSFEYMGVDEDVAEDEDDYQHPDAVIGVQLILEDGRAVQVGNRAGSGSENEWLVGNMEVKRVVRKGPQWVQIFVRTP